MIISELIARNFRFLPKIQSLTNEDKNFYLKNMNIYRDEILEQKVSSGKNAEEISDVALMKSYKKMQE